MIPMFDGAPHVLCSQQFTRYWLENTLFSTAREMRQVVQERDCDILRGKRVITFFYEPSTRTRCSFECAANYLGARVVFSTENAREFSSAKKGETLMHTMHVLNMYQPDAIILRYDKEIGSEIAASVSSVPIINAGDRQPANGPQSSTSGQHPTQAFLDIFTMQEWFGHLDGLRIAMVGDLRNGRTVRSLSYILAKFKGIQLHFVSPESARMRDDVKDYLVKHSQNIQFTEENDLRKVASLVDVVYQTRTQTECGASFDRNNGSQGYFLVNMDVVRSMHQRAIIMHPLPCIDEIDKEVDGHPRAVYLNEQIMAGLLVRMALLKIILKD